MFRVTVIESNKPGLFYQPLGESLQSAYSITIYLVGDNMITDYRVGRDSITMWFTRIYNAMRLEICSPRLVSPKKPGVLIQTSNKIFLFLFD